MKTVFTADIVGQRLSLLFFVSVVVFVVAVVSYHF